VESHPTLYVLNEPGFSFLPWEAVQPSDHRQAPTRQFDKFNSLQTENLQGVAQSFRLSAGFVREPNKTDPPAQYPAKRTRINYKFNGTGKTIGIGSAGK